MMMPVGRLAIIRTFAKSELLVAMNFVIIPALIGPLLGPTVGGLIVHWLSWREIFFVNVPVGMVALLAIHRHMPDYRGDATRPARSRRAGVVRQRRGASVLAARDLRRARDRPNLRCGSAVALDRPARGLWLACTPGSRSAAATSRCSACARFASRWSAASSPGWAWAACPSCCRCSTSSAWGCPPWESGLLMMPAGGRRDGHEVHLGADPAALRLTGGC